jgi:hypothetical protein
VICSCARDVGSGSYLTGDTKLTPFTFLQSKAEGKAAAADLNAELALVADTR